MSASKENAGGSEGVLSRNNDHHRPSSTIIEHGRGVVTRIIDHGARRSESWPCHHPSRSARPGQTLSRFPFSCVGFSASQIKILLVSGLTTCRHSVEDSGLADELRRAGRRTMADQAQFEALIRALMSEKNEERTAAEAQFEALVASPAQAAPLMCTAMATSADMTVRSMTTVMFRKRVNEGFYKALAPETQAAVKAALIGCVQNENDAGTRKKMADTTGEVACMIMEDNPDLWPEMFPFLFTSAQSPEAGLREAAHIIMSRLAFSVSAKLAQDVPSISTLCGAGMQDPHKDVRLAALSATGSIVQALSSYEAQVSALTGLVPVICGRFCDSTYERSIDARTDPASVRRADADFERER